MKKNIMIYAAAAIFASISCIIAILAVKGNSSNDGIRIKALVLPKFEIGSMTGDFPGEAQYYYDEYVKGGDSYDIGSSENNLKLFVKDGIALCLAGMSKVNSALNTMLVLTDPRFDFSKAYVISTGCAGSAIENSVMGDVFIMTGCADYDLGHHADSREMTSGRNETWFHDADFDETAIIKLNETLANKAYDIAKNIELKTTERTRNFMKSAFPGETWAARNPMVLKGSTLTGDNYWKGIHGHENALLIAETYGLPDAYATTEMEDAAIGQALKKLGMLDRYIIIRDSVNMDVFMMGETPESLWNPESQNTIASDDGVESADIFTIAMENNYKVGKAIIDAIKNGKL